MKHCSQVAVACAIALSKTCLSSDLSGRAANVNAVAGVTLPDDIVRFAMLELRKQTLPNLSLAAAVAYLDGRGGYEEAQLRLSAIWLYEGSSWTIENRHLLAVSEQAERYRCRLRLVRSLGQSGFSMRAFDELYVDLEHGFVRSNLAIGVGAQLASAMTAEIYHVWVDNHENRDDNYVLALLTVRF